jgi:hypothetical protein
MAERNQMGSQRKQQASKWKSALDSVRENMTINQKI